MAAIVEDLRINVFGNGQYLYSTELILPRGSKLDTKLLEILKVTHQKTKKIKFDISNIIARQIGTKSVNSRTSYGDVFLFHISGRQEQ